VLSRTSFFSITFVAFGLAILATVLLSSQTYAWAPTATPPWSGDLSAKLDTTFAGTRYENWRDMNYATGNYNGSSFIFAIRDDDSTLVSDAGSGLTSLSGSICRWDYSLGSPGCNPLTQNNSISVDIVYTVHVSATLKSNNPTGYGYIKDNYSDLITPPGNPLDPGNDHTPQCEPWDVGCWFNSVIGNVVDGYQSLADTIVGAFQAMGDWIANLIMPSNANGGFDNRFTDFFTTVQHSMTERLGFLLFPFQFITDLVASLTTIYNPYGAADAINGNCTSGSHLSVPHLLGDSTVTINPCGIENTPIWTPVATLLRFVWIVGVVGFLHHKYFSVVKA
jgi:hypothetical protein